MAHSVRTRRFVCWIKPVFLLALLLLLVAFAAAQKSAPSALPIPSLSLNLGGATANKNQVATSLQILALLTVLSVAPAILMLTTAFTRIVIVFSFVRSALGTPTIPPNQVLVGLSLFLTAFVMAPTYQKVNDAALKPLMAGTIGPDVAFDRAATPMRDFMLKSTYESDLRLFLTIRKEQPRTRNDLSLITLIPAFIISELKTAFIIGFYIFVPFLVIDLIVASSLMSMGMMMMPPTVVSLPAKILVFVLADGWGNLVSALLAGYR
jgi:flagellar biosynthetic protein FliP